MRGLALGTGRKGRLHQICRNEKLLKFLPAGGASCGAAATRLGGTSVAEVTMAWRGVNTGGMAVTAMAAACRFLVPRAGGGGGRD